MTHSITIFPAPFITAIEMLSLCTSYRYTFCYPLRAFLSVGIEASPKTLLQKGRPFIFASPAVHGSTRPCGASVCVLTPLPSAEPHLVFHLHGLRTADPISQRASPLANLRRSHVTSGRKYIAGSRQSCGIMRSFFFLGSGDGAQHQGMRTSLQLHELEMIVDPGSENVASMAASSTAAEASSSTCPGLIVWRDLGFRVNATAAVTSRSS